MKPYKPENWRHSVHYPERGCNDQHRLAWEFLRRHPDYAAHAEQMLRLVQTGEYSTRIKRTSDSVLDGVECWPQANPGETAKAYFVRMKEIQNKRPRIDIARNTFLNRWSLEQPVDPATPFESGVVQFASIQVKIRRHVELKTKSFNLFLHPNEVALRFRLDLPITEQLKIAKERLDAEARKFGGQVNESSDETKRLLPTNSNSRLKKRNLEDAHYWLRCYDADREPKRPAATDKRKRRLQASGPANQCSVFNDEQRKEGRKDFYDNDKVDGFLASAVAYIDGKKFLLLLRPDAL